MAKLFEYLNAIHQLISMELLALNDIDGNLEACFKIELIDNTTVILHYDDEDILNEFISSVRKFNGNVLVEHVIKK